MKGKDGDVVPSDLNVMINDCTKVTPEADELREATRFKRGRDEDHVSRGVDTMGERLVVTEDHAAVHTPGGGGVEIVQGV